MNNQNFFSDMMKMMENNPMMKMMDMKNMDMSSMGMNNMDMSKMTEMQKSYSETMNSIYQSSVADCQAIMKKCTQMAHKGTNDMMKDVVSSMNEKSPDKVMQSQSKTCKKAFDNCTSDVGEVIEMVQKSNMDMYKTVCNKMTSVMDECMNAMSQTTQKSTKKTA